MTDRKPAKGQGSGLRELRGDDDALEEAWKATDVGLMNGMNVTPAMLRVSGERLRVDVIDPLTRMTEQ